MPSYALRLFLRIALLVMLVGPSLAQNNKLIDASRKEKRPRASLGRLPIIDAHTHTDFSGKLDKNRGVPITQKQYFEEWRRAGVVGAISHSPAGGDPGPDLRAQNVMSCVGIDAQPNVPFIEDGLRSGRYGCIKIYLGYVYQYAYDKNYQPVYELAEKYDVPVVFHTGDTDSSQAKLKFADPLTIDEVAVDHPKVRFVLAHSGNPWIESAAEVAYKNPNVYLDGSALLIGNLDRMPRGKVDEYVVRPLAWVFGYLEDPGKLMFGSDWPLTDINSYVKAFKRAIPREHWKAVFHDNAVRVFRLKIGLRTED
ncbi:MAG: amidohydrolase family protein [Blastocatellia bacterium]